MVTATLESQKYKQTYGNSPETTYFPEVISGGTPSVSALYNPTGLAAYWPLNDGSGTAAYDQSGNGDNGTLLYAGSGSLPIWSAGKVGQVSLYFNPATTSQEQYVQASPVNVPATSGSALSVAMWINPNASQTGQGFFLRNGVGSDENYGLNLTGPTGGYYSLLFSGYTGSFTSVTVASNAIPATTWSYLVIVFTQNTSVQTYLNGTLLGTTSYPYINAVATTHLNFGGNSGSPVQTFNGYLDDVRIYSRALSAAEVKALYAAEK